MIDYKKFEVESKASLYDCGNRLRRRNMMALLPDVRGKIVIEFGFGIGDFRMELRKRIRSTYKEYVGVDISLLNLRAAKHIEDSLKLNDEKNAMISIMNATIIYFSSCPCIVKSYSPFPCGIHSHAAYFYIIHIEV